MVSLERNVKLILMNVMELSVRMVELAKMESTLSHVTAMIGTLETCVKLILMNVMELSVKMVEPVRMELKSTIVIVPVDLVEKTVRSGSAMVIVLKFHLNSRNINININ